MRPRYSKDPQVEKSLRHSLRDGVAHAVMTGGLETYFSAFALFLKANASQVALVATLPNAIGSLAQLFSAWLGHKLQQRKPIVIIGAFFQAALLPLLILLVFIPRSYAIPGLVIVLILYFFAAHTIVPQWYSLMGELVPVRKRGRYFSYRTRLATSASFIALATSGVMLHVMDHLDEAWLGFVSIIIIAFIARLYSAYNLRQMHEPHQHPAAVEAGFHFTWLKSPEYASAKWFSAFVILMNMAVGIAAPFFSVYMLRDLQYSYLQFMLNTGTAVLVQILALNYWGRISDVFGNRSVLMFSGTLIPVLPALWLVSPNFWYLICVQALSGFAWAGFNLSSNYALYDLVPQAKRATYQALHNVLLAVAVFVGGMLGSLIIRLPAQFNLGPFELDWRSALLWAFLLSAATRATVALIFLLQMGEFGTPRRRVATYQLIFRFTRFNAFMGLAYEVVGKVKNPKPKLKDRQ